MTYEKFKILITYCPRIPFFQQSYHPIFGWVQEIGPGEFDVNRSHGLHNNLSDQPRQSPVSVC
jgi:hypothetical protein